MVFPGIGGLFGECIYSYLESKMQAEITVYALSRLYKRLSFIE
jgi:hypothetical protein